MLVVSHAPDRSSVHPPSSRSPLVAERTQLEAASSPPAGVKKVWEEERLPQEVGRVSRGVVTWPEVVEKPPWGAATCGAQGLMIVLPKLRRVRLSRAKTQH